MSDNIFKWFQFQKDVKEYLDTCLTELLTQHNVLKATLSPFTSLESPTFCTKSKISHVKGEFIF